MDVLDHDHLDPTTLPPHLNSTFPALFTEQEIVSSTSPDYLPVYPILASQGYWPSVAFLPPTIRLSTKLRPQVSKLD